ncbi:MAG: ubiquinol-cytochrome c reductase iron-sulfur subunit [Alphaproteobacteria bacterium]|nr:MAG: ubiquinol-cytochrome c reductase iron-sulfur subunit [Alphaproteobacteria bacterium]
MNSSRDELSDTGKKRRDFITLTATAMGGVLAGSIAWPLLQSMNPAADTLAESVTEVNLAPILSGAALTVIWQGKPVFIRHRTDREIAEAVDAPLSTLPDPQEDKARVQKPQWLVVMGICTHLGCVPLGQKKTETRGEYGGWFCPCHGSHYDTSGRIRKGPAPTNLVVPPYNFISDQLIRIGREE